MATLDYQQLTSLWVEAGGSPEWAPTMAAVALGAESSGNTDARNASGATGLWQIIMGAQSASFQKQWAGADLTDPLTNAKIAVEMLGNGSGISNWGNGTGDAIGTAVQNNGDKPLSAAQAQQYITHPPIEATLTSDVTTQGGAPTTPATTPTAPSLANLGATGAIPTDVTPTTSTTGVGAAEMGTPIKGADVKNFMGSGIDLSAIPPDMLGNAENAVKEYIEKPGYAQQIQNRITQDFGYSGTWITKIPELYGVLVWAATSMDPSDATDQNLVAGAIENTNWWKTSDQNQRAWDEEQFQDPATAQQDLIQAQEKVQATANQIGVKLNKSQMNALSTMYAAQSFTQSGVLGSQSGTSQEWLDQAVIDATTTIKATGKLPTELTTGAATAMATPGAQPGAGQNTELTNTNPTDLTGLASTLYQDFQQTAQQYLMYNPNGTGYLTSKDLMDQVNSALASYTGTGSSGLVSQFANNANAAFQQQMMQKAGTLYGPTIASAIAQGTTPQQYMSSEVNTVASTLGIQSGDIDLTSPQWSWLIGTPNAQGVKEPLSNDQIMAKITQPNFQFQGPNGQSMTYDQTDTAKQNATTTATGLSQMFGVGGT